MQPHDAISVASVALVAALRERSSTHTFGAEQQLALEPVGLVEGQGSAH
jgi:hypothetical protein